MSNEADKGGDNKSTEKKTAAYLPPFFLWGSHLETLYPALLRRVQLVPYQRERIFTPDDDFLDLDWLLNADADRAVIISHGLEGNSQRPYIKGMATARLTVASTVRSPRYFNVTFPPRLKPTR